MAPVVNAGKHCRCGIYAGICAGRPDDAATMTVAGDLGHLAEIEV
jgi:hypothetical protein